MDSYPGLGFNRLLELEMGRQIPSSFFLTPAVSGGNWQKRNPSHSEAGSQVLGQGHWGLSRQVAGGMGAKCGIIQHGMAAGCGWNDVAGRSSTT